MPIDDELQKESVVLGEDNQGGNETSEDEQGSIPSPSTLESYIGNSSRSYCIPILSQ